MILSFSHILYKGILQKVKDYFVRNSYFFNRRIGAYSESESWIVLLDHFYQLKAPIQIPFMYTNVLADNLENPYY